MHHHQLPSPVAQHLVQSVQQAERELVANDGNVQARKVSRMALTKLFNHIRTLERERDKALGVVADLIAIGLSGSGVVLAPMREATLTDAMDRVLGGRVPA